ncbi:hypothetical protein ACSQ67_019438 [Phaseolus vulgaris]
MTLASLKFARKPTLFSSTPFLCVRKVVPRFIAGVGAETLTNIQGIVSIREEGKLTLNLVVANLGKTECPGMEEAEFRGAWDFLSPCEDACNLVLTSAMSNTNWSSTMYQILDACFDCVEMSVIAFDPVMRTFSWCEIVGKRFPVCHVQLDGTIVEVSSFDAKFKADFEFSHHTEALNGVDKKDHVRTIIPAETSFKEDCAHILRAIRIAARIGFSISKEAAHHIRKLSSSVLSLDKGRLLMEMNHMLAYGSGEASLRLLWKFGLLDILFPFQAAYFAHHGFQRRDRRTNMLLVTPYLFVEFRLSLFSNLDKLLAPNRPCHNSLWVGILALHKTLSDRPRDPLAVAAFSITIHNGGNLSEAVYIAGMINKPHDVRFPELLNHSGLETESLEAEILDLAESVRGTMLQMTNEYFVSQAMADYPQAPHSNLVFIPLSLYLEVYKIFDGVRVSTVQKFLSKQRREIDYDSLALGNLQEVRHVFARVVFDTVYPIHQNQSQL